MPARGGGESGGHGVCARGGVGWGESAWWAEGWGPQEETFTGETRSWAPLALGLGGEGLLCLDLAHQPHLGAHQIGG